MSKTIVTTMTLAGAGRHFENCSFMLSVSRCHKLRRANLAGFAGACSAGPWQPFESQTRGLFKQTASEQLRLGLRLCKPRIHAPSASELA
jgi:hypothetical protein